MTAIPAMMAQWIRTLEVILAFFLVHSRIALEWSATPTDASKDRLSRGALAATDHGRLILRGCA